MISLTFEHERDKVLLQSMLNQRYFQSTMLLPIGIQDYVREKVKLLVAIYLMHDLKIP
jgi:hypothetical protein